MRRIHCTFKQRKEYQDYFIFFTFEKGGGYCDKDCPQKENFKQMFATSTVLMLQKWQTPKFGLVQNFQNTGYGPENHALQQTDGTQFALFPNSPTFS